MSGKGIRGDAILQLISQNVTEHQIEDESDSFYLSIIFLGIIVCITIS